MQLLTALSAALLAGVAAGQSASKINDFSAGPTKVGMYAYVPKSLPSLAPIVVAVHHCQGSATA